MIVVRHRPEANVEERTYHVYGFRRVAVMQRRKDGKGCYECDLTAPSELKRVVIALARQLAGDNSTGAVDAAPSVQRPSRQTKVLRR